jgi:hypothetical protein
MDKISYPLHFVSTQQMSTDFPPRRYWTSSLTVPWWVNKRQVTLPEDYLPNPPMATITRGYSMPGWSVRPGAFSREYSQTGVIQKGIALGLEGYSSDPCRVSLPRFTTEYVPDHEFQVPCDTITPSSERYLRTGTIEIIR